MQYKLSGERRDDGRDERPIVTIPIVKSLQNLIIRIYTKPETKKSETLTKIQTKYH